MNHHQLIGVATRYSREVIFFDFCRGMQGLGPALLIPNAIAVLGRQYPEESLKKNIVFGLFGKCHRVILHDTDTD